MQLRDVAVDGRNRLVDNVGLAIKLKPQKTILLISDARIHRDADGFGAPTKRNPRIVGQDCSKLKGE
jgi:hypothetical protein